MPGGEVPCGAGWPVAPSAPPGAGVASHPHLSYPLRGWGGNIINSFDSNSCQGTAGVLSGRDAGPGLPDLWCRARPGSAGAASVPNASQGGGDMVGPCTLLFLSLPRRVLLIVVTDIAFKSEKG